MSESEAIADRMRSEIEVSRASVTEMMRQLVEAPGDSLDSDVGCVKPLPGEAPSNPTHSTSRAFALKAPEWARS
ncbi:hypothetical protein V6N13_035042 [Hibiscus sabdariffa]|uniref:Uncharacterized protein n=2 Tax=Hibiscus sabdariffa TaxID=183260 RepID=A0ABR2AFH6_9ROSI